MIVGLDVGTQSLKAVVTDDNLSVLGVAATSYQTTFPGPGKAEQDTRLWENAMGPTIARALAAAGCRAEDVRAIGIGGQLDGCIAIDAVGRPIHPCLIWSDRRAEEEIVGIPSTEIRERAGIVLDPSHMAAKIRWLKRNLREARCGVRFHQPVSYLVFLLTGQHVIDDGVASTTMLYSLQARAFDPWLLELFQIEQKELPAIADATSCAGTLSRHGASLTGLRPGIPVAVGTGDDFSTPLGAGLVRSGKAACILGTAEVVGAVHHLPESDDEGLVETHAYMNGQYFIENPGWLSGGALAWLNKTLRLADFKELDALAEPIPPGAEGLTFLPTLSGATAPEWIPSARGCFYGLTPAHSNGHMARATLEGTALAMRDVIERLVRMDVQVRSILLLGGGARSNIWAKIRADMTGLPVEVPTVADTSAIGAAMIAAVAAEILPDLATAAEYVGGIKAVIEPIAANKTKYDEAHAAYRKLFDSLRPMFGSGYHEARSPYRTQ